LSFSLSRKLTTGSKSRAKEQRPDFYIHGHASTVERKF